MRSGDNTERPIADLAMLPFDGPSWWNAGRAYQILDQLVRVLREREEVGA